MIVQESTVVLPTLMGEMHCLEVYPGAGKGAVPGIVFFSEIFQITEPIKRIARFMAGNGFRVLVPEIFHELGKPGCVLGYDQASAERGNSHKVTKTIASYDSDANACIDYLVQQEDSVGVVGALGVCIGGHLAFRAAFHHKVAATACFYATDIHKRSLGAGMNDDSLERAADISGELMMIWGRQDPHISTEGRRLIQARLEDVGTNYTWHEFNAQHAFMRDEGVRFDPALAHQCYGLVISLMQQRLR
jgi:carboxymethylenebutenolidase